MCAEPNITDDDQPVTSSGICAPLRLGAHAGAWTNMSPDPLKTCRRYDHRDF
jgi:hypothetical protein